MCTHIPSMEKHSCIERTVIHMDTIEEECIDELIREGGVFHTAGGLMIEHHLVAPKIQSITGSRDAVMGMSQESVIEVLLGVWHCVQENS